LPQGCIRGLKFIRLYHLTKSTANKSVPPNPFPTHFPNQPRANAARVAKCGKGRQQCLKSPNTPTENRQYLEMVMMYYWLHDIVGDEEKYWQEYLSKWVLGGCND